VDKSAEALRRAVEALVMQPELRARMGQAGRKRVEGSFNPSLQMARIVEACFV